MKSATKTQARVIKTVELTAIDIIKLLKDKGEEVPADAEVYFTVPDGGDWSRMNVDISEDAPIRVQWTTKEKL